MMNSAELSVVLVNKYGFDRLRRVIAALSEQSIADRLELVIVSPFDATNEDPSPFAAVRYVKCGPIHSLGPLRAAGVLACSAPFLVFGEDHCFPRPGWAGALLSRLREGWMGVGPLVLNHNPSSWVSRADYLLNYGSWFQARNGGPVRDIPPHNSAYPTAVLQALGRELPELLQMDHHLQFKLRCRGGRLFLEPAAQVAHTNVSRGLVLCKSQFSGARIYGATRAAYHRWTALRRGFYAAVFPAIGVLRLIRACALLPDWRALPVVPLLTLASMMAATGEACGYLFGSGSALLYRVDDELDRASCLIDADRHLLFL